MASDKDVEVDAELLDEDELVEPGEDALLEEELDVDDLDPDALDPDALDPDVLEDDVLGDEVLEDDDALGDELDAVDDTAVVTPAPPTETPVDSDEAISDDDDDEDDDEDEVADVEDRADGTTRVLPKQPGEFVCQSCFLVKSEHQLADQKRMLCRDCV